MDNMVLQLIIIIALMVLGGAVLGLAQEVKRLKGIIEEIFEEIFKRLS